VANVFRLAEHRAARLVEHLDGIAANVGDVVIPDLPFVASGRVVSDSGELQTVISAVVAKNPKAGPKDICGCG
jgi:hypothetical protein